MWRLAVIGSPVAHSKSPQLHEAALRYLDEAGTSERIELDGTDLDEVRRVLHDHDGVSVTMPLKALAARVSDELDETSQRIGYVNSVMCRNGQLSARSTDGDGLIDALAFDFNFSPSGLQVAVIGAGGSAWSIVDALAHRGANVRVLARNAASRSAIEAAYPPAPSRGGVDLVINTVPSDRSEVADEVAALTLNDGAIAIDVRYAPVVTEWMTTMARRGARSANGLAMLAHQAHRQVEWWFERPVPVAVMREAVGL